jgi:hypothetical protein
MGKKQPEISFSKSQVLSSDQISDSEKDALAALLEEKPSYTVSEVNKILRQFATKEVV